MLKKIGEPDDVKALGNLLGLIYELFIYFLYLPYYVCMYVR